jgi:hypothetical protein
MCIGKPECQNCQTCGNRKYQLWAGPEMHDRGCPFGFDRMDRCHDAVNHAKLLYWSRENGVRMTEQGLAKIDQFLAAGVDLTAESVDFDPLSGALL